MAMMAMTTSNSISVKPRIRFRNPLNSDMNTLLPTNENKTNAINQRD